MKVLKSSCGKVQSAVLASTDPHRRGQLRPGTHKRLIPTEHLGRETRYLPLSHMKQPSIQGMEDDP